MANWHYLSFLYIYFYRFYSSKVIERRILFFNRWSYSNWNYKNVDGLVSLLNFHTSSARPILMKNLKGSNLPRHEINELVPLFWLIRSTSLVNQSYLIVVKTPQTKTIIYSYNMYIIWCEEHFQGIIFLEVFFFFYHLRLSMFLSLPKMYKKLRKIIKTWSL